MSAKSPTVFLGMSGGVDSSVSAVLLKEQGYHVVGVYMKNWSKDLPGMKCPWAEDLADAKRVAVKLGLDFLVFDFEKEYKAKVVDYMLSEFRAGRTPNPDIMCNAEIKFKLFLEESLKRGADLSPPATMPAPRTAAFSSRVTPTKTRPIFSIAFLAPPSKKVCSRLLSLKPEVKRLAEAAGLANAHKKESMGVCFVGDVGMKDFLREYIAPQPGEIRELETDRVLGFHDGAVFYTLGQRHGLYLGGGLPYYVVKKDLKKNLVYVSKDLNSQALWTSELSLENLFFRSSSSLPRSGAIFVRLRHRAPLLAASFEFTDRAKGLGKVTFPAPVKRPASGQSVVFYTGTAPGSVCLGGGILV